MIILIPPLPSQVLLFSAASEPEGDKPKRGRPCKNASSAAAAGAGSPPSKGRKAAAKKKPADAGPSAAVLDEEEEKKEVEGLLVADPEEEDEEGVEYEYDEEALPEEMRALLQRPSRGLAELLEEAGIEFGDPSLMDDVVDGGGPEGFRAGGWMGGWERQKGLWTGGRLPPKPADPSHDSHHSHTSPRPAAGFVTIVGSPNVGKSTLMNALVGERVSIVTSKQQTTRHQIMGVVTGEDFQIVYYDTPGVLRPDYKLQEGMMAFVKESLGDADVVLLMTDVFEDPGLWSDQEIFAQLQQSQRPLLLAVNKVDVLPNETHPLGRLGKEALKKVIRSGGGGVWWCCVLCGDLWCWVGARSVPGSCIHRRGILTD
jgi:small GTP-binding protein